MLLLSSGRTVREHSFGIVPLQRRGDELFVYIVQHRSQAWLLPKGRREAGESPQQTAERELLEETGLRIVAWQDKEPLVEHYAFEREGRTIDKTATYFFAFVEGDPVIQEQELLDGKWVILSSFEQSVTFPEMKRIAREVERSFDRPW